MPKYHFLTIIQRSTGRSMITLPGQTFGRNPVPEGWLVKDVRGSSRVEKAKRSGMTGEIFFTTTLKASHGFCTAKDIYSLEKNDSVFFSDAKQEYESLIKLY